MILLGGMLHDLECYVDRRLFFDVAGNIVRRAGGIRRWLRENLPDLAPHYKTLMRYKAMAIKLRQATDFRRNGFFVREWIIEQRAEVDSSSSKNGLFRSRREVIALESESPVSPFA